MSCMLLNTEMDNKEIRHINLVHLREAHGYTSVSDIADATDIARPQMSGYLSGTRPIGDNIARRIENTFKLPRGWMDVAHDLDESSPRISGEVLKLAATLSSQPSEKLEIVKGALKLAGLDVDVPSTVVPLPHGALVVTDPVEKNLINTYRQADSQWREFLANTLALAKQHPSANDGEQSEARKRK